MVKKVTTTTVRIGRSAITGRFITVSQAVRNPRITTVETIKLPKK